MLCCAGQLLLLITYYRMYILTISVSAAAGVMCQPVRAVAVYRGVADGASPQPQRRGIEVSVRVAVPPSGEGRGPIGVVAPVLHVADRGADGQGMGCNEQNIKWRT